MAWSLVTEPSRAHGKHIGRQQDVYVHPPSILMNQDAALVANGEIENSDAHQPRSRMHRMHSERNGESKPEPVYQ